MSTHNQNDLNHWLATLDKQDIFRVDLGLDRMQAAVDALRIKSSTLANRKVITVAGTNGKGSTVTLLSELLRQNGFSVGSYLSPHVFEFNERIRINLEPISDAALVKTFNEIEDFLYDYQLTYFEFVTLTALKYFSSIDLDYVILEVGLGGRLDAVNVISADMAIVTNIELDHTQWLGETREAIAKEKAGVFRPHQQVIYSHENMPYAIQEQVELNQAKLYRYGADFGIEESEIGWTIQLTHNQYLNTSPSSFHKQQVASVTQAYYLLMDTLPEKHDFEVNTSGLIGRLQSLQRNHKQYLVDVAHNEASIVRLVERIISMNVRGKVYLLFSTLEDKAIDMMINHLKPYIDEWCLVEINNKRAMSLELIKKAISDSGVSVFTTETDIQDGFHKLEDKLKEEDLLVVAGSFCLLSELREELGQCVT